jgi:polysaccharide deacetylase 2 family uncharacterized protein YibQ/N-acetylmuramoyl-L-alanine amidase
MEAKKMMSGKYKKAFFLITLLALLNMPAYAAQTAPSPLKGKVIILDPGHGGSDHGYCRQDSACERDIDLEIVKKTAALLNNSGASVFITRGEKKGWLPWQGQSEISLDERISLAGEKKADIFVSIHCNASPRPHRTGAVVFYRDNCPPGSRLGDSIQRELVKIPENGKRTDKPGDYYLLNRLSMPAVVIESCYLTHDSDKKHILDQEYQKKFASAVFTGIEKYLCTAVQPESEQSVFKTSPGNPTGNFNYQPELQALPANVPGGIKINSIKIKEGQAHIDIGVGSEGLSLGGEEEYSAVNALVNSVLKDPQVSSALITVNGLPVETLAGHIDISSPITRRSPVYRGIPLGTKEGKRAQVAIVIDDFGQYRPAGLKQIFALDIPVTCAVMPNMENTVNHAEEASRLGHEVIVHLPLEPVAGKKKWLGPGAIGTDTPEDKIRELAEKDFSSVPHAVGFNNHMGSAATASVKTMRTVLQVAREKEFFVLDSKTTGKTKIPVLAREMGIPILERTVFLDDVKNKEQVKSQLLKLSREALSKGKAIGIGHVGKGGEITAAALQEMIPQMEKMGVEFVYLSEMAF